MKKPGIIFGVVGILLLLLIGFIFYFSLGVSQTIIPLPIQTQHGSWLGIPVTFSSVMFGSQFNDETGWGAKCGDDGDVKIYNSYSTAGTLSLTTYVQTYKRGCDSNFIEAELTIPEGKLTGTCDLLSIDPTFISASASCNIKSGDSTLFNRKFQSETLTGGVPPETTDYSNFELIFDEPTEIKILVISTPSQAGVDSQSSATLILEFEEIDRTLPLPISPSPSGWDKFKSFVLNLIKSLLSIFRSQAIVGFSSVAPGSIQTYQISVSSPVPDSDYNDGYYEVQYSSWALTYENGTIVNSGAWEQTTGSYIKTVTITIPQVESEYFALVGMTTQLNGTYNYDSGLWTFTEEQVISQEAIDIKTKYSISPPVDPTPGGWTKFWDSLKNVFCRILPFFC